MRPYFLHMRTERESIFVVHISAGRFNAIMPADVYISIRYWSFCFILGIGSIIRGPMAVQGPGNWGADAIKPNVGKALGLWKKGKRGWHQRRQTMSC